MQPAKPSQTALAAAWHRAVHHLIDDPVLLPDPALIAVMDALNGGKPANLEGLRSIAPSRASMRALIVARKLFAQETLARAVERGVRQYVLLGAGLDTFAYQHPFPAVRVFEVDHPATGAWKRESLAKGGVAVPENVVYAPIDFERDTLAEALARAGFDLEQPAAFAWLGVIPYLTRPAIETTLGSVGALPAGTEIVFDYGEPRDRLPPDIQAYMKERMAALSDIGEPWISFFDPADMAAMLRSAGFGEIEDLNGPAINARWFEGRRDGLMINPRAPTSHVLRARV